MTNLHIEIGNQLPVLETDPDLRTRVQTLVFDNDKFRNGLVATGLPEAAVGSLLLKATYDEHSYTKGGVYTTYNRDKHTLAIVLNDSHLINERELKGAWDGVNHEVNGNPISNVINYDLARYAQYITDKTVRNNTSVALDRLYSKEVGRSNLRLLSRLALAGSGVGAEMAHDLTDYHPILGSSAGLVAAFFITVPVVQFRNRRDKGKYEPLQANLNQRAEDFAQSQHAHDLFDGVVRFEWLK